MDNNLAVAAERRSITSHSASELAQKIAGGEVTALEAVEAYIARIEAVNPELNALVVKRYDEARAEAKEIDRKRGQKLGPLAGVPVTIKECLDLAGTPSTFGLPSRKNILAARDEKHVAKLREAGAIVLGKTNVSQLLLFLETDNPLYGRTNHPEKKDRSPGGSSGGEGALLGAGASALGLGTDIGGSVRVPAAFCGLHSIKPTMGRCDDGGRYSVPIGQRAIASQVGVLGRSVDDIALGLEVISEVPIRPSQSIENLRIAWYCDDGTFSPSPAIRRAVKETASSLEKRGARVREWSPPKVPHARDLFYGILAADGFSGYRRALGNDRRDPRIAKIEIAATKKWLADLVLGLSGRGRLKREVVANYGKTSTDHYWQLVEALIDYRERFLEAFSEFDALICPATALPAFRHGAAEELVLAGAYTCLFNVLGWPAGVAPATRVRAGEESDRAPSSDKMDLAARETERDSVGLPVGVQIAARPWREDLVFSVMRALGDFRADA